MEPASRSSECAEAMTGLSSGSTHKLDFSSPEVGSPGRVISFLNIVGTWSGKGTLGPDLHTSHLGHLVGKACCWTWAVHLWFPSVPPPPIRYSVGEVLAADSILRVEG